MKKLFLSLLIAQLTVKTSVQGQQSFDLVIKNAYILDGTGNKAYKGMIAVKEGKIVYVGKSVPFMANTTVDAKQNVAAPGFIDVHTHPESKSIFYCYHG